MNKNKDIEKVIKNAQDVVDEYVEQGKTKEVIEAIKIGFMAIKEALKEVKNNDRTGNE